MNNKLEPIIGLVPDGFYSNGDSKPLRKVQVLNRNGDFAEILYLDTKEKITITIKTIYTLESIFDDYLESSKILHIPEYIANLHVAKKKC